MGKMLRRCSLLNFFIFMGLFWLILLAYFYTSSMSDDKPEPDENLDFLHIKQAKLQIGDEYEDPRLKLIGELGKNSTKPKKLTKKDRKRTTQDLFVWPVLSEEVKELHRILNLTNPGHMGQPVNLPANLPADIAQKINKSWEIYSINEFVSTLIPLDRDLPDIRPEYCRTVSYVDDLPMTSVIMVFHNEPLSMILRSVFAVFKRTSARLLKEIVLVDDCSTHGELEFSGIFKVMYLISLISSS
ncbi:hypothetical protein ACKWTF_014503 [Chironomus riparius]